MAWYIGAVEPWLVYVLISLTTFSVTRLVIQDSFPPFAAPRNKILNWLEPDYDTMSTRELVKHGDELPQPHLGAVGRSLHYLLQCPWCASFWVACGVTYVFTLFVSVPLPIVAVLVARAVTGLISRNLDSDDEK